ncbi:hypothetical protein HK103_005704 [Boothiomyces macroporosus]|uniref:DOMON domain-containing protein n=1 Tax=Boothiomyces macroporosus TaxID=261099 RepID=A0AAD5UET1_9FUNG|nr:hypothetical protein HK103_005704 [Boothiomyces macroporosus]
MIELGRIGFKLMIACALLSLSVSAITSHESWIPFPTDAFTNHQTLTTNNNKSIELFWAVDSGKHSVTFGVASQNGAGWLALGTSDAGGMIGADIWLGYTQNSKFVLEDRFSAAYDYPSLDSSQDVTLLSSYQTNSLTAFTFSRNLDSCDNQDAELRLDSPMWFIYAFGSSNSFGKHAPGDNGQALVDLSGTYFDKFAAPSSAEDTTTYSLITPKVNILPEQTTYCYSMYDVGKDFPERHHIVQEDYQVGGSFLHHIVAYECENMLPEFTTPSTTICNIYGKTPADSVIKFNNTCQSNFYTVWAKGGKTKLYPSDAGKPIGGNTRYIIFETHYTNPEKTEGLIDNGSGFHFKITKNLRKNDIGVFVLGTNIPFIFLPPGQYPSVISNCGEKCMTQSNTIPENGLTMISTMLHMHTRGKAMGTKHIRNGKELTPWPSMNYYDFNFQSAQYVSSNVAKILPGDRLITNCTYDTSKDTTMVFGGHSTFEEMCLNFLEYYPAMPDFKACTQVPDLSKIPVPKLQNFSYANICPSTNQDFLATAQSFVPTFVNKPSDFPPFTPFTANITCPATKQGNNPTASSAISLSYAFGYLASLLVLF